MASTTTQWILELVDKLTAPLRSATDTAQKMTDTVEQTTEEVEKLGRQATESAGNLEKFGKGMFFMNEIKDGIDNITGAFDNAIEPGVRFQYAMAQVQAISGISGEQLELVSGKARELAKTFGVDAAEATGVFSNLLSQLGPHLAQYPDALDGMARNALTLSKTMDGDVNGAVSALTTSFNAFIGEADNAEEASKLMNMQMNLIAKSAQVGAAEVVDIAASLKNIGPAAKNLGVSFAETNAIFQVLGQNQIKAAEAGTALRNAMLILAAPSGDAAKALQAMGVDMATMTDKTIPFADRLKALVPVMNDTEVMARLFGRENAVAGQILVGNIDKVKEWTDEVQNSNSANEQAAIIMDTSAERMKRMQAWIDDLKISFFEFTEPFAPFISILGIATGAIVTIGMTIFSVSQITSLAWGAAWSGMTKVVMVASRSITAAIASIPIVGWIAIIVSALISLGVYFYNTSAKGRGFFWGVGMVIKNFVVGVFKLFFQLHKLIFTVLNPANWFQPQKMGNAFTEFTNQVKEIGKSIGGAYQEGMQKGMADYEKSHPKKEEKKQEGNLSLETLNQPQTLKLNQNNAGNTSGNTGGTGSTDSVGLGGSGKANGGVRNITMNVTMNNSFTVSGEGDYRKIVERVKRDLIAVLSDVSPAIG